ncbi:hypothetical protein DM01DRAFT_1125563 [Hesseltinella vesiculosa]|uniref:SAC3/GANP/THP3 conserved domain-containing protein n=1 Tax=Hesseltinella vesiculosa TaxID=101127 RepID=A0A1X2GU94_9FUNG|nr:hypothetical protein DM01DRAFT_1125563 [Hesseltinella vesiculosa]
MDTMAYEAMKKDRIEERREAIEQGLIQDPLAPTTLEDAIDFRGTCEAMCPRFEMVERSLQNGLDPLEMNENGELDPEKAVKRYRRSAAGNEQPLPSDVRSPLVLLQTLDYLVGTVLPSYTVEKCHPFIRDRTRSIRQDFTLQNIRDRYAIEAHERIARFHILALHELCGLDEERFSIQQETEQLNKVLISLMEFYDDLREEHRIDMPNEPEFRAYNIISHLRDPDTIRQTQSLPPSVFRHPLVTRALKFSAIMQRNNEIMETSSRRNKPHNVEASQNSYAQFFNLVADPDTPFLMACMLEAHFPDVRKGALKAMNLVYRPNTGPDIDYVIRVLGYDSEDDFTSDAALYGLKLENGQVQFNQRHVRTKVPFFIEPLSNPKPKPSQLVEPKKLGTRLEDIVNGIMPSPSLASISPRSLPSRASIRSVAASASSIVSPMPSYSAAANDMMGTAMPSHDDTDYTSFAEQEEKRAQLAQVVEQRAQLEMQIHQGLGYPDARFTHQHGLRRSRYLG